MLLNSGKDKLGLGRWLHRRGVHPNTQQRSALKKIGLVPDKGGGWREGAVPPSALALGLELQAFLFTQRGLRWML